MKVYVAGGMRDIENFNIPAFDKATKLLRELGCEVFNPCEADFKRAGLGEFATLEEKVAAANNTDIRQALAEDMWWICTNADAICMLPGWDRSQGATAEYCTARALGLPVMLLSDI